MISDFRQPQPIIGRDRERRQLLEALDRLFAGTGGLVLISGEAGIGKTTLVNDLTRQAAANGVVVLTGGCYDMYPNPPYGPWLELLRNYQPDDDQLKPAANFGIPVELENARNQAEFFECVYQYFAAIASVQPLILLLEDVHWADQASLDLLRYIARNASPLVYL